MFSTVFSTVRGVSLTRATPIVRYSEQFLQAARALGATAVSVVRNLEVVRYSGAAITLQSTLRPPEVCINQWKREFIQGLWEVMIFIPRAMAAKYSPVSTRCNFRYERALISTKLFLERATPQLRFGTKNKGNW